MSGMVRLETLLPLVLPQTLPCPKSMALDALRAVAVDFFSASGVWVENLEEMAGACETAISPVLPANAVLHDASRVFIDGRKLGAGEYAADSRGIILKEAPGENCCVRFAATLRPKRTASELPRDLLEEYGDCLAYGAIARLKGMSGNKVEWSDPKGASLNWSLYNEGLDRARKRRFRKRFGASILYVQNNEWE